MAKPATAPKKKTTRASEEETVSKKPQTPPKKEEKVEHQHTPLPVLKPVKPLDVATLRKRLLDLGIKWDKKDDADALKAKLDAALKEKAEEVEDDLLDDENDCYGKPDMRMVDDPDCKRCPDFKRCGDSVAKVLDARKDLVTEVEAETDAEVEADETDESSLPKTKRVGRPARSMVSFLRPEDVTEMTDSVVLDYDDEPPFDDDDSDNVREAVKFIYQHKPETMADFRRIVVLGYLRKKKSDADEMTVGLIQKLAEGGFFRIKSKVQAKE